MYAPLVLISAIARGIILIADIFSVRLTVVSQTVTILYHPEDADEVMHGTGLRLSSHYVSSAGEEVTEGGCSKAVSLAQAEKDSFVTSPRVMTRLRNLFGTDVDGRVRSHMMHVNYQELYLEI